MKCKNILLLFFSAYLLLVTQLSSAQPHKLIVLLDWFANPSHAPLFVAQQQGYFKEAGLEVELIGPADPTDPPKLVAAGKADIAITYQPHYLLQIDQGLPLKMIGSLIDKPLNCVVALKESTIKTVADLKGKRIGYSSGGVNSVMLKTMLKTAHLSLHDVERINVHYDLSQALLSKKVDAVSGMMRTFEVLQMEQLGHPVIAFYPEDFGMPPYSELIFVVNAHKLDSKLESINYSKFLQAVQKGTTYLSLHPESCWLAFAKKHPENNNELNHRAWFATLTYFAKNPQLINSQQQAQLSNFLQQNGLIANKLKYSQIN